jgi:hypothetical protein
MKPYMTAGHRTGLYVFMHESSLFISKPPHNWFGEERRRMAELEDEGEPMKEETNNSWAPLHSSSSPVNPQLMMSALLGFSVPPSVFICSGLLSAWRPGTLRRHHPSTVEKERRGLDYRFTNGPSGSSLSFGAWRALVNL